MISQNTMNGIYMSPDEARDTLHTRFSDTDLKNTILAELEDKTFPFLSDEKIAVSFRQLVTPDNGFLYFYFLANYIGAKPTVTEYLDDMFVSLNEEKKALGRIVFSDKDQLYKSIDIMNFKENERKTIRDCTLIDGSSLAEFHHHLFTVAGYDPSIIDMSKWFKNIGKAKEYYYYLLLHFVAHGVLVETFYDEGGTREDTFTHEVVYPAIQKIKEKFGLKPIIVRAYPEHQTPQEDLFWWDRPRAVGEFLTQFATTHNIEVKEITQNDY